VPRFKQRAESPQVLYYHLSAEQLAEFENHGWALAGRLLVTPQLTSFEKAVLGSILLFSRAIESRTDEDRLVYALVAAEALLLRGPSEPIMAHLWLRLALLAAEDVPGRREIKKLVQDAYKQRSAFAHHGVRKVDSEVLRGTFVAVWTAIRNALMVSEKFETKVDFLDYLENRMLASRLDM
jgi:hypothetical protein